MFKFEDIITLEEKAVMYGIVRGQVFNKRETNKQLDIARKNKFKK